jgi:hypothetical protein
VRPYRRGAAPPHYRGERPPSNVTAAGEASLVGTGDVVLQPIFEELQNLHGHSDVACLVIGLKTLHLFHEILVLPVVRGQIGIAALAHEALFIGEMD